MAPMTGVVITDWSVIEPETTDLKGKSLLVIGGTSGLGQAIAKNAVECGASVTVVGRSFKDDPEKITFVQADLSSMKEAKKIGETVEPADVVLFTAGVVPKKEREVTAEGLEMDMAVSYLSRMVILQFLAPRLKPASRVFIMGFPGSNNSAINWDDLNAEAKYEGGFGAVHMTTVAGNEALVIDCAKKTATTPGVSYFGLNPGLIKSGIRSTMYEGWMKYVGVVAEGLIGLFFPSAEQYAAKMVPLLFATNLDEHNGSMFNPKAQPVKASAHFDDKAVVDKLIRGSEALITEKTGISFS